MINKKNFVCVLITIIISAFCCTPVIAKKLVSEARSVIQRIESKGSSLSNELSEFHSEFSSSAQKMVKLEETIEQLKRKGYLGKEYKDSPEKYERLYAEYAKYMSEIKNVFVSHLSRIQRSVTSFNRSIYEGKDRITELRSDDLAVVDTELKRIKQNYQKVKSKRESLESNCPKDRTLSRNCKRQWKNYDRQRRRITQSLKRIEYMKKISKLKDSISDKLAQIMDRYVDKEADIVEMLKNYAFSFEQYADFIGSNKLGGMLKTIGELAKLETKMKDFEKFQQGLDIHVGDMGNIIDKRLDHFIEKSGMADLDSRSDMLGNYNNKEEEIERRIERLEN
ncbi:hypothetical protein GMMP15_90078 [Candidatus Magnetomoraceae bacterium gMMP-15]